MSDLTTPTPATPQAPERPVTAWGTGPDPNLQRIHISDLALDIFVPKGATDEQIGETIRSSRAQLVQEAKRQHNTQPIGSIIEQRAQELGIRPVQQNNNAAVSASSYGFAPVGPPKVGLQGGLAVAPALQQSVTNETNRRFQGQRMRQGLASPDSPQDYDVSQQMHQMAIMGIPAPPNVNQVVGAAVAGRPFDINAPSFSQALLDRYTNTPGAGQAGATLPGFPAGVARGLGGFMEPTSLETMAILGPLGTIPEFSLPILGAYEGLQGYGAVQNARQVQIDPETGRRYHDVAGAIGELTAGQLPLAAGIWGARESAMNRLPQEEYMRGYNWRPPTEEPPVTPRGLGPGPRPQPGQPGSPGTPPPEGQGVRFSERFNTSHGKSAPEAPRGPVVTTEPLQPGDVITSRFGGRLVVHADDGGPTIRVSMNEQPPINVPRSALFGSPVESGGPAPTTATAQPTTAPATRPSQVQPTQSAPVAPVVETAPPAPPAPVNIPTAPGFTFAPPAQTPSVPVVETPAPAPPASVSPEVAAWQQTLSTPRAQTQAKIQHELAAVNLVKQGVPLPPQAQADYPHLAGLRPGNFGKDVPSELSKAYAEALTNRDRFPDEPEFQRRLDAAGQAIVAHQNGLPLPAPSAPSALEEPVQQIQQNQQNALLSPSAPPAPVRVPVPKPAAKPKGKVTPQQTAANETGVHVGEKGGKTPASQKVKSSGFTSTQEQFLGNALREAMPNLPEHTTFSGEMQGAGDEKMIPRPDYSQGVKIDVPGDGRFEVASQQQAKALLKLIGQDAEVKVTDPEAVLLREFGKASKAGNGEYRFYHGTYKGEPAATNTHLLLLNEPALYEAAKAVRTPHESNIERVIPQGKDLEGYRPTRPVVKVSTSKYGGDDVVRFNFHDEAGNPLYILKKYVDAIYKRGYTLEAKTRLKPLIAKDASGNIRGIVMPYNGESIVAEEELPYAMPKGAPKQPAAEAQLTPKGWDGADAGQPKVYVSRQGTQTKTVYVSPDTARMLTGHFGLSNASFGGANVNPDYVPPLLGALDGEAQDGVPGAAELAQNIRAMQDANGSVKFTVTRKNLPEMRQVTIHEDTHRAQINWKQPSFEAMNGNVYFDGAWARLRESGYRISQPGYVREVGARLVAGQYDSLGLDQAEGDELLAHYVEQVYHENGAESVADTLRLARGTGRTLKNEYKQQAAADADGSGQADTTPEGAARRGRGGTEKGNQGESPACEAAEFALSEPAKRILDEVRNNVFEGLSGTNRIAPASADAVVKFASTPQVANLYMRVVWPKFEEKFDSVDDLNRWQLYNVADAIEALHNELMQERSTTRDPARRREIDSHLNALARPDDPITGDPITIEGLQDYFNQPDVQDAGDFYEEHLYPVLEEARLNSDREANGLRGLYGDHFVPKYALGQDGQPLAGSVGGAFSYGRRGKSWQVSSVPGDRAFTGRATAYVPEADAAFELRLRSALKAEAQRNMYRQLLDDGIMVPAEDATTTYYHEGKKGRNGLYMEFQGKEEPAIAHTLQDTRWAGRGRRVGSSEADLPSDVVMPSRLYNEIDPALELAKSTPLQEMLQNVGQHIIKGYLLGAAEKIYHSASLNSRMGKMQGAFGKTQFTNSLARVMGPGNSILNIKNVVPGSHPPAVRFEAAKMAAQNGALPHDFAEPGVSRILYGENGVLANAFAELYQRAGQLEGATQNADGTYNLSPAAKKAVGLSMRKMNVHTSVQVSRLQTRLTGGSQGWLATFYQTGSRNRAVALQQPMRFLVAGTLASQLLQMGIATAQHRAPWQQPNWKPGNVRVGTDSDGDPIWSNLFSYFDRTQYLAEWPLRSIENSISNRDDLSHTAKNFAIDGWNTESEPVFSGPFTGALAAASGRIPGRFVPSDNLKSVDLQPSATAKEGALMRGVAVGQAVFPLSNIAGPAAESHPIQNPIWHWAGVASGTLGGPRIHKEAKPQDVIGRHRAAERSNRAPVRRR